MIATMVEWQIDDRFGTSPLSSPRCIVFGTEVRFKSDNEFVSQVKGTP